MINDRGADSLGVEIDDFDCVFLGEEFNVIIVE